MFDQREPGQFKLAPELAALQRKLAQLTPTAPRVDRDQLMFDAGRAAERTSAASRVVPDPVSANLGTRVWPAATATMTAATVLLSAMLVWQHRSQPTARQIAIPQTIAIAESAEIPQDRVYTWPWAPQGTNGYLGVRNVALVRGVGAIPPEFQSANENSPSDNERSAEPATARELLNELLPDAIRQRS